jgi:hypothetical protein
LLPDKRDKDVASTIADIWMARQGYDAMMFNEQGLFSEAVATFDKEDRVFSEMVEDLDNANVMMSQRESVREASSDYIMNLASWSRVSCSARFSQLRAMDCYAATSTSTKDDFANSQDLHTLSSFYITVIYR